MILIFDPLKIVFWQLTWKIDLLRCQVIGWLLRIVNKISWLFNSVISLRPWLLKLLSNLFNFQLYFRLVALCKISFIVGFYLQWVDKSGSFAKLRTIHQFLISDWNLWFYINSRSISHDSFRQLIYIESCGGIHQVLGRHCWLQVLLLLRSSHLKSSHPFRKGLHSCPLEHLWHLKFVPAKIKLCASLN